MTRAPIVEALVDVRVSLAADSEISNLDPFCDSIAARYPARRIKQEFTAEFELAASSGVVSNKQSKAVGYLLSSADGKHVVQARLDGFSFSRLAPYTSWAEVRAEAHDLWLRYVEAAKPTGATRAAVRFINRLRLPLPFGDFREYLLTVPDIAPALPQGLASMFLRVSLPFPEGDTIAFITETTEQVTDTELPFIFDIDVVHNAAMADSDAVWRALDECRDIKNRVFFGTLTRRAVDLFL